MVSTQYLIAWSGSALPLGIAALGELVGQRCGVVNLGIEGTMLAGGFVAWVAMHYGAGSAVALLASAVVGLLCGLVFWIVIDLLEVSQQLTGLSAFFAISGITMLAFRQASAAWPDRALPFYDSYNVLVPALTAGLLLVIAGANVWLARSRAGIALSLIGRDARSADLLGIPVRLYRLRACLFASSMASVAGAITVLFITRNFRDGLVTGRGWIAICLVILASWNGWALALILIVWSCIDLVAATGQIASFPISYHLLLALPYLAGILALPVLTRRKNTPQMLFRPYRRNENAA